MRRLLTFATAAALALPHLAAAQSLAEIAAREREKRKGQKPTGKVITEDDLRRGGQGRGTVNSEPTATASPAPGQAAQGGAAAAAGAAEKPKTDDEVRAEQEKAWRDKLKKAQDDVQRVTQALDAVQKHLGDLTGNLYGSQRTTLLTEQDKLKAELQTAQQQVAALEDEGRRSRFRP
jgi:DNA repair exonuclease SbcCD ATPase subunit